MQIQCPSGLVFTARRWRIGDHSEMLDTREQQPAALPKRMLELAATGIVEPGPYKFKDRLETDDMSIADITVANILIRVGTDPRLLLKPTCGACRKPVHQPKEIDLSELQVYQASKEGVEHLRTGSPLKRVYNGIQVELKAIRGRDLGNLAKLQEQEPKYMIEHQLAASIAQISAPGTPAPLTGMVHIREFLHEQEWDLRSAIEDDIDELWGGVDQTFSFQCDRPSCLTEQEQQVPLDLTFYGLDLSNRRSSRRKRSSVKSAGELMRGSSSPSSSAIPKPQPSTSEG